MLIEIAGLPGSGKTTMLGKLKFAMNSAQLTYINVGAVELNRPKPKLLPRFVKAKPERAPLYRYTRFQRNNKELDDLAFEMLEPVPIRHFLFSLMAANYQAACDLAEDDDFVFIDEGFIAHGAMIFNESDETAGLKRYVELAPPVDAVLFVNAPAELAFDRVKARAGDNPVVQKKAIKKLGSIEHFQRREGHLHIALKGYAARGVKVINLDATLHPGILAKLARKELINLMKAS